MTIFDRIGQFFSNLFGKKEEVPLYANCSVCGKRVYLPFLCHYCHNYYCGEHRLPFSHDCKNIDDWKNRKSKSGPATKKRTGGAGARK
ncbi:MAG: AN1-type zinc finger domain-containing protein [Methanoregula sp.]